MKKNEVTLPGRGEDARMRPLGLNEETRFVLSAKALRRFTAALRAPAREIPALRKLLKTSSVLEQ